MKRKIVLVCVAHRDDETIGCGGTISKHVAKGDKVYCLSMTDGVSARVQKKGKDVKVRLKNSIKASKILGFNWINIDKNFDDNEMDKVSLLSVIKVIEKVKEKIQPDIIYTHYDKDLNIDHRIVSQAVLTAFRPMKDEKLEKIFFFEVLSATDYSSKSFIPNYFNKIDKHWKKKNKALKAYGDEILKTKTSRNLNGVRNLAMYRGNFCGHQYAEAFKLIREIDKDD